MNKKFFTFAILLTIVCGCSTTNQNEILMKIANDSLSLGNPEAALGFYDKVLKKTPNDINAKIGKIEALINIGRLDIAMYEAQQGINSFPECESFLYSKGKILLLKGNVNAACKIFKQMPNNYKALNALGTIYDSNSDHSIAQTYYMKALQINNQYADALGNLGLSIALSGDNVYKGIEYLERANTLPGNSQTQKNNLALAYGLAGEYNKALAVYEEIMPSHEALLKLNQLKKLPRKNNKRK